MPRGRFPLFGAFLLALAGCAKESEESKALRLQAVADLMEDVEQDEMILKLLEHEVERVEIKGSTARVAILVRMIATPFYLNGRPQRDLQILRRARFTAGYDRDGERWELVESRFDPLEDSKLPPAKRVEVPAAKRGKPEAESKSVEIAVRIEKGGYRLGDKQTKSTAELERWLIEAKKRADAAGVPIKAQVEADHAIPHAEVIKVLTAFEKAKIQSVEFFGGKAATKLPFPDQNAK